MTLGRTNCFRALAALGDERPVAVKGEQLARPSRLAMGIVRAFAACAMLLAGIGSLAYALTGSLWNGEREAVAATIVPAPSVKRLVTAPIETIRPGQRVLADRADDSEFDESIERMPIHPSDWRLLSVRAEGTEGAFEAERLVATEWIDQERIVVGCEIPFAVSQMDAPSMVTVTGIGPCPEIEPDDGTGRRLVTAVFRSVSRNVVDVTVEGSSQSIGCTATHPFWSVDRRKWVPAGQLRQGERRLSESAEAVRVVSVTPRRGPPTVVYNLEVDAEHVYRVGEDGVLVHNHCVYMSRVNGEAEYVGRTNNFTRRRMEHAREHGREVKSVADNITYRQARALEHELIAKYGRKPAGDGILSNINRGISARKIKHYAADIEWAREFIKSNNV